MKLCTRKKDNLEKVIRLIPNASAHKALWERRRKRGGLEKGLSVWAKKREGAPTILSSQVKTQTLVTSLLKIFIFNENRLEMFCNNFGPLIRSYHFSDNFFYL